MNDSGTSQIHPLENDKYLMETPEISRLLEFIKKLLKSGVPGAMVVGERRAGKTYALDWLRNAVPEILGIPFVLILGETFVKPPSVYEHYTWLVDAVKHPLGNLGKGPELRKRFREWMISMVAATGQSRVIIAIDDARLLYDIQFSFLMTDSNWLLENRVRPLFLLVDGRELEFTRKRFVAEKQGHYIGRFFIGRHEIRGIRSEADMKAICMQFDAASGTGDQSFSQYFRPLAFEEGWRLANHSEDIYRCFKDLQSKHNVPSSSDIPAQYFFSAINILMVEFRTSEGRDPRITYNDIEKAVIDGGYIWAMVEDQTA